jgi:hypothetical protein
VKENYRIISYALWGVCLVTFMLTCQGGAAPFIIAIASGVAAYVFSQKATTAHAEEREELEHQIQVKDLEFTITKQDIREEQIEREAKLEIELRELQQQGALKAEHVRQKESDLQGHLVDIGIEQGLKPEAVSAVNEHKYRTEIDLDKWWKGITQDLDAGDLLDLSDQQLIKKQTERLEEMYRRRYEIANGDDPPEVKEALLGRYDKNIRHLEVKIDARQTGLLLSENGQEARRLEAGEADSGADSTEAG